MSSAFGRRNEAPRRMRQKTSGTQGVCMPAHPKFTLHISLSNLEIARRNPVVEGPENKLDPPIALANVLSILPEMDEQS